MISLIIKPKTLTTSILFLILCFSSYSQQSFYLPEGYNTYKTGIGEDVRCDADFDNDGLKDLAILCVDKDETYPIVVIYLTTRYLVDKIYFWFPWNTDMQSNFTYSNGILSLYKFSISDIGGLSSTLSLKYFRSLKDMRLVEFKSDFEQTWPEKYSSTKVINLLTGEFSIDNIRKKTNFDVITLSNIEKYLDYLELVGNDLNKN